MTACVSDREAEDFLVEDVEIVKIPPDPLRRDRSSRDVVPFEPRIALGQEALLNLVRLLHVGAETVRGLAEIDRASDRVHRKLQRLPHPILVQPENEEIFVEIAEHRGDAVAAPRGDFGIGEYVAFMLVKYLEHRLVLRHRLGPAAAGLPDGSPDEAEGAELHVVYAPAPYPEVALEGLHQFVENLEEKIPRAGIFLDAHKQGIEFPVKQLRLEISVAHYPPRSSVRVRGEDNALRFRFQSNSQARRAASFGARGACLGFTNGGTAFILPAYNPAGAVRAAAPRAAGG